MTLAEVGGLAGIGSLVIALVTAWRMWVREHRNHDERAADRAEARYAQAQARADELDRHLADAQGRVAEMEGTIASLEGRLRGLEDAYRRVSAERDQLRSQLSTIYREVGLGVIGGMQSRGPVPPQSEDSGRHELYPPARDTPADPAPSGDLYGRARDDI